jgi:D-aminoacyl-tRNA deacylase
MVTLIVATTADPASINPAAALLAMPGWTAGPILPPDIKSFSNKQTRVIQHDRSIVKEDDLDLRWEEATGEVVDEVIFLSRHTAVSNRPALTVHPIGSASKSKLLIRALFFLRFSERFKLCIWVLVVLCFPEGCFG